ncbi:MAG TPA: hypothetical protein EYP98_07360 [Planctomycetes bacterium]|nr:hypothetical protein [Planctomycetota bacterium]
MITIIAAFDAKVLKAVAAGIDQAVVEAGIGWVLITIITGFVARLTGFDIAAADIVAAARRNAAISTGIALF